MKVLVILPGIDMGLHPILGFSIARINYIIKLLE